MKKIISLLLVLITLSSCWAKKYPGRTRWTQEKSKACPIMVFLLFLSSLCIAQSNVETYSLIKDKADYKLIGYSLTTDNGLNTPIDINQEIVRTDSIGNIIWTELLQKANSDEVYNFQPTIEGGFIIAGQTHSESGKITGNPQDYDYWVIKISPSTDIPLDIVLFPNPFSSEATLYINPKLLNSDKIKLIIYNILGEKLRVLSILSSRTKISKENLAPGIYSYVLTGNDFNYKSTFIID